MPQPVQNSLALVKQCQKAVNEELKDMMFAHNRLELNRFFTSLFTRLEYMGAVLEPEANTSKAADPFPPIKNFMGKDIVIQKAVTAKDLNPQEFERQLFRKKVQKLYDEFIALGANTILKTYTIPEDVLVVRGVAKWAGIKEYETRELTVALMEEIAAGIKAKEEAKATHAKIEQDQEDQARLKLLDDQKDETIITQADIDSDKSMMTVNAVPGDKLSDVEDAILNNKKLRSDKERAALYKGQVVQK